MSNVTWKASPVRLFGGLTVLIILYKFLRGYTDADLSSFYNPSAPDSSADSTTDLLSLLPPGAKLDRYCANYRLQPYPDRYHHRKVYDLITINDELDWLLVRLRQMSPSVDYFIVIESEMTFSNQIKPLHVFENWDMFEPYQNKMLRFTLNETGQDFSKDPWARESFSRNAAFLQTFPLLEGEATPSHGDVVLVGDVDEIPRPEALNVLRQCQIPRHVRLYTKIYYYSFQWLSHGRGRGEWDHPDATFFEGMADTKLPQNLRGGGPDMELWNAGWHCSFCFPTLRQMISKVQSFSHTEMNRAELLQPRGLVERVRRGEDIFMRSGSDCVRVEGNEDVPGTLLDQQGHPKAEFRYLFDRDGEDGGFVDYWELLQELEGQ